MIGHFISLRWSILCVCQAWCTYSQGVSFAGAGEGVNARDGRIEIDIYRHIHIHKYPQNTNKPIYTSILIHPSICRAMVVCTALRVLIVRGFPAVFLGGSKQILKK